MKNIFIAIPARNEEKFLHGFLVGYAKLINVIAYNSEKEFIKDTKVSIHQLIKKVSFIWFCS